MPGRAERIRRARRLAVVTACVTVALLVALLDPGVRHAVGGVGDVRAGSTPAAAPRETSEPAPTATRPGDLGHEGDPPPTDQVGVSECGTTAPVVRPAGFSVVCSSTRAGVVVSDVVWGSWGQLNALGTAAVLVRDCHPTCADGDDRSYAATVVLDRVVTTRGGSQFSRATVLWSDTEPDRFPDPLQVRLRVYAG